MWDELMEKEIKEIYEEEIKEFEEHFADANN